VTGLIVVAAKLATGGKEDKPEMEFDEMS